MSSLQQEGSSLMRSSAQQVRRAITSLRQNTFSRIDQE
ncbi:hypothetical protein EV13_1241 [Prochlorococcus sp. MIT 0702]|nr:hypothetical protein EV12_2108 [Prochlorococcus sp. MIT 0701]KGG29087.1 hypothetical protein EV13_1241 [Prochlorococcus sp. MIT 0702]KGG32598.1 hypothetical protein EV14_2094 [Prochlorococcus sp. MIT 0703]